MTSGWMRAARWMLLVTWAAVALLGLDLALDALGPPFEVPGFLLLSVGLPATVLFLLMAPATQPGPLLRIPLVALTALAVLSTAVRDEPPILADVLQSDLLFYALVVIGLLPVVAWALVRSVPRAMALPEQVRMPDTTAGWRDPGIGMPLGLSVLGALLAYQYGPGLVGTFLAGPSLTIAGVWGGLRTWGTARAHDVHRRRMAASSAR